MNMKPRKNKVKYILVQLPEDVTETIKKAKTPSEKRDYAECNRLPYGKP